jgi:hypothetical protein
LEIFVSKIISGITISLDGFVNDRNGSVAALYPDLADGRETKPGKESIQNTGAVVMGRNSFAMYKFHLLQLDWSNHVISSVFG